MNVGVGADHLAFQPQLFYQGDAGGFFGEEAVGTLLDEETVELDGGGDPSGLGPCVQEGQVERNIIFPGKFFQAVGARKATDPGSDDDDP